MDHLKRLRHRCCTCDYAVAASRALAQGWVDHLPETVTFYCCRLHIWSSGDMTECPHWSSSYDGFDALKANSSPGEGSEGSSEP